MKKGTMVQNALWLTGSELFLRAIAMLFQVYLSNRMGAAGVGLLQLVLTAGVLAATLALSGVKVAAMYLTAQAAGRNDRAGVCSAIACCLRYALAVSSGAAVLLFLLAPAVAGRFVQDSDALLSLRAYALLLPAGCLAAVMHGYCTAVGKVRRLVCVELAERIFSIGLTLLLLSWADGNLSRSLFAIITGACAPPLGSFSLLYVFYRREHRCLRRRPKRPMLQSLLAISVPLALSDYLRAGLNTVEQFLIPYGFAKSSSRYLGLSAYGTISGMVFPVMMFPAAILHAISDLLVPELSRCAVRGEDGRILSLTERCLRLTALFAAAVSGTLFCAADGLGQLIYHSETAGQYLRMCCPMVLFLYLDVIVDGMLKGLGQQIHSVRYNTFTNVLDVAGLYTLLPRFGVGGYIFTYAATHLVNFFLSLRRLLFVTDDRISLRELARLLALALLCGALACRMPTPGLFSGILIRGGSYLILLLGGARLVLPTVRNALPTVAKTRRKKAAQIFG